MRLSFDARVRGEHDKLAFIDRRYRGDVVARAQVSRRLGEMLDPFAPNGTNLT
jgi:hypothetical protein